jgi:regulator of replication initiation timing
MAGRSREQVIRWLEESRPALDSIRVMLHECAQLKMVVDATQTECARLRQECDHLRATVSHLTAETERLKKARAETVQWVTTMMNETAARLLTEPSPAGSGRRH